jgi:hypothetical protein
MIRISRIEPLIKGPDRSSIGQSRGQWTDVVRKGLSQSVQSIERLVIRWPSFCLGAALSAGIALGWWVKRP